jgi:hypothetical protein
MSDWERNFHAELGRVRAKVSDALAGSGGDFEPGLRAALDHAMGALPRELASLRAHGFDVEPGSYFLASQLLSFAIQGINPLDAIHHRLMGRLLREYVDRARALG